MVDEMRSILPVSHAPSTKTCTIMPTAYPPRPAMSAALSGEIVFTRGGPFGIFMGASHSGCGMGSSEASCTRFLQSSQHVDRSPGTCRTSSCIRASRRGEKTGGIVPAGHRFLSASAGESPDQWLRHESFNMSAKTSPKEYTSAGQSYSAPRGSKTSGAMYAGVPATVWHRESWPTTRPKPKSATLGRKSLRSKTFAGFMSRCIAPCSCA
mmetsp:Transcript_14573/g.40053  ORF Transcript_14573/g.40053 Transcript_14573/m.40053 type:complete len:210 (-) Transcript_14573:1153-1782(-)